MTSDLLIDRFENGGVLLSYAVTNLNRDHERARPGPGSWSSAELVVHLLDADLVGGDRMKRVIAEDNPTLLHFDESAWVSRLSGQEMPVEEAVSLFANHRRWMARLLRQRPESDFSRIGEHTERGRVTLAELVRSYVGHVDHHLKFLYAKRGHIGMAIYPRYSYALE